MNGQVDGKTNMKADFEESRMLPPRCQRARQKGSGFAFVLTPGDGLRPLQMHITHWLRTSPMSESRRHLSGTLPFPMTILDDFLIAAVD
jgi:hypothetical protein